MIKITQIIISGWLVSIQWSKLYWMLPNERNFNPSLLLAFAFKGLANHLGLSNRKTRSLGWNTFCLIEFFSLFIFVFVCIVFCFVFCFGKGVLYQKKKKRWGLGASRKCHLLEHIWSFGSISSA